LADRQETLMPVDAHDRYRHPFMLEAAPSRPLSGHALREKSRQLQEQCASLCRMSAHLHHRCEHLRHKSEQLRLHWKAQIRPQ
jgi:hypothetical protein